MTRREKSKPCKMATWSSLGLVKPPNTARRTTPSDAPPPNLHRFKTDEMKTYGLRPLAEDLVLVQCSQCGRQCQLQPVDKKDGTGSVPVAASSQSRKRKISMAASSNLAIGDGASGRQRRASTGEDQAGQDIVAEPHPYAHLLHRRQAGTSPGFLNIDSICGVKLSAGASTAMHRFSFCTRPITCKIHSMTSKSLVEGRSKPFWVLLRDYHARVQKGMLGIDDVDTAATAALMTGDPVQPKQPSFLDVFMVQERVDDGTGSPDTRWLNDPTIAKMVDQILQNEGAVDTRTVSNSGDDALSYPLPPMAYQIKGSFRRTSRAYRMRHVVLSVLNANPMLQPAKPSMAAQTMTIHSGALPQSSAQPITINQNASKSLAKKSTTSAPRKRASTGGRRASSKPPVSGVNLADGFASSTGMAIDPPPPQQ